MKKKDQNKGFTLVELIVVLVILAILAAILVPALLGYIDQAKNKQAVLNAKSALTAAQAEMSNIYATKSGVPSDIAKKAHATNISKTADFPSIGLSKADSVFKVGCNAAASNADNKKDEHSAYTITWAYFKDDTGVALWFNGAEWTEWTETSEPTAPTSGAFTIFPIPTT